MLKILTKPTIVKRYAVSQRTINGDSPLLLGTCSDIGMDHTKLASGPEILEFTGISTTENFMYNLHIYGPGEKVYFVTNVTQSMSFIIVWQEYI